MYSMYNDYDMISTPGLDPNAPATNGVPDGEYIVSQSIEADNSILSSVNTAESPYELSIDIKTNGDAEKELTVDESGYSVSIENEAMLGTSINIEITDTCNPEEIVLKYIIKEDYTDNILNKFSSLDEFNGIKRLNVFRFDTLKFGGKMYINWVVTDNLKRLSLSDFNNEFNGIYDI